MKNDEDNMMQDLIDEATVIVTGDILTIDNPVFRAMKEKLNNALAVAVLVADGSNAVTISAKLVIDDVTIGDCGKKMINQPTCSIKVSSKNDIYDNKNDLDSFLSYKNEQLGYISAVGLNDENQISLYDIQGEKT